MTRHATAFLAIAALALLAACGDESSHETGEVSEQPSSLWRQAHPMTSAEQLGLPASSRAQDSRQARRSPFVWTRPEGWEALPATRDRLASFRIARDLETECFLSLLSGGGGGLPLTVNRWRKQMGLDPASPAEIEKLPRRPLLGREAALVDLEGTYTHMDCCEPKEGYRMLGLVLEAGGQTLFLKMTGRAKTVAEEAKRFEQLASSLRVAPGHAGAEKTGGSEKAASPLAWTAPETWIQRPARSMRLVTFTPGEDSAAECYVTVLGGRAGGTFANVNLWRQQLGQPPLDEAAVGQLETIEVLGKRSTLVEVAGTYASKDGEALGDAALLGLICPLEGRVLFVKMTGPASVIRRERDNFVAFCKSLKAKG